MFNVRMMFDSVSIISNLKDKCTGVIVRCPMEVLCLSLSYFAYLYTGNPACSYYGIPILLLSVFLHGSRAVLTLPVVFAFYMTLSYYSGFGSMVLAASLFMSAAGVMYYISRYNPSPAWSIIYLTLRAVITAAFSIFLLTAGLVIVCVFTPIQDITAAMRHIFTFSVAVVSPLAAIHTLKGLHRFTLVVSRIMLWIQLLIVESIIVITALLLLYSSVRIALMERIPKPYVVYISVAFIIASEFASLLHVLVPRKWYDTFFRNRGYFYLPVLFMGLGSLYVEFSIVGFTLRTFFISILYLWILSTVLSRFAGFKGFFCRYRNQALFFSVLFVLSFILSFVI